MRSKGKLKYGNNKKSFGFVAPFRGEKHIFIHISAFSNRDRPPRIGDVVTYTVSKDKQGRPCATKAAFAGEKIKAEPQRSVRSWIIVIALIFMLGVGL